MTTPYNEVKGYHDGVDVTFLEAMGIKVVFHQPWQLGLFHDDLTGKFVWYPKKGTLMYEEEFNGSMFSVKLGESGDYLAQTPEQEQLYGSTERVYEQIIKKVKEQNI